MRKREPAGADAHTHSPPAELDEAERIACLRLIRTENVGPVTFRELIGHYGRPSAALAALPELSRRSGRALRIFSKAEAEAELEAAKHAGAQLLFTLEGSYPAPLAAIEAAPPLLYVRGSLALLSRPSIAIVGSRQASAAGTKLARQFAAELGQAGVTIVSGLARGIDAAAHEASLDTGTAAVLAGGIDIAYPPENAALQQRIAERGTLISERPPGFEPRGKDFPRRNRLISGISLGVLVIEAARKSGTLITARLAAEQGREVFAVPGHPLDPRAEGTNRLLKNGATLATEASDVLLALEPLINQPRCALGERAPPPISVTAQDRQTLLPLCGHDRDRVLSALGPQPVDIDEIARATGLGVREVRIALLELDLAGCIERHGAQLVSRAGSD